ncbi:CapA family protein [Candidatus Dojkabacteria bacterium]|nr:CapA family protein [Candidatus Dojkabacteria bacterium]
MSVVLNFKEKTVKESKYKGRSSLTTPFLFVLSLVAASTAFFGYIIWDQFPNIDINSVLLPVRKVEIPEYKTYEIAISKDLDSKTLTDLKLVLGEMKLGEVPRFRYKSDAEIKVEFTSISSAVWLYKSYLVPVGHMYWISSDIKGADIAKRKILTTSGNGDLVKETLTDIYGIKEYNVAEVEDIAAELKDKSESEYLGLVPIDSLAPDLQIMSIGGSYFLEDPAKGGLVYGLTITGDLPKHIQEAIYKNTVSLREDEFTTDKVAKINMTGVTAITRALANKMDATGDYGYPASKISEFLKDADLTHVSNEVSFVSGCKYAEGALRFCSRPETIKTLKDSGVDIVELTGNHNNDYGATYNKSTIELYNTLGWGHFGGGVDSTDAAKFLIKEVKGNKVAFLGYNYYDTMQGTGAVAGVGRAGANSFSFEKMDRDIKEARKVADVVIVDFQFQECYSYPPSDVVYPICYRALSSPDQKGVFRKAVDYGADIVIGTQAHQPQTYEIYNNKMIFYGLGNLFFDQIYWIGTRQGLILSHYLYNGKVIQTKVTTTLYDNDMKTYVTTGNERESLLQLLKEAR